MRKLKPKRHDFSIVIQKSNQWKKTYLLTSNSLRFPSQEVLERLDCKQFCYHKKGFLKLLAFVMDLKSNLRSREVSNILGRENGINRFVWYVLTIHTSSGWHVVVNIRQRWAKDGKLGCNQIRKALEYKVKLFVMKTLPSDKNSTVWSQRVKKTLWFMGPWNNFVL